MVFPIGGRRFEFGRRTYVMGVINVTPDSFSDGGKWFDPDAAVEHAVRLAAQGADILDVGGESTRPEAVPISLEEELRRVLPVLDRLVRLVDVPISIDTYKAEVARQALRRGVHLVNDVWGLTADPEMAQVVARYRAPVVLMHNQRQPVYREVVADVIARLEELLARAEAAGIPRARTIVDPGLGFGKNTAHNLEILRRLGEFRRLGRPILIGPSRKRTIGHVLGLPVDQRVEGTAACVAVGIAHGADIVRVHDVQAMARVARMADAIVRGWHEGEGS